MTSFSLEQLQNLACARHVLLDKMSAEIVNIPDDECSVAKKVRELKNESDKLHQVFDECIDYNDDSIDQVKAAEQLKLVKEFDKGVEEFYATTFAVWNSSCNVNLEEAIETIYGVSLPTANPNHPDIYCLTCKTTRKTEVEFREKREELVAELVAELGIDRNDGKAPVPLERVREIVSVLKGITDAAVNHHK